MAIKRDTPLLRGITSKLLLTIVLAAAAIVATVFFMRSSFSDVLQSVDRLADPNEKLGSLNDFYKRVSQLEREHQVRILQSPSDPISDITNESDSLIQEVEHLKSLEWNSPDQYERLDSLKSILELRKDLLVDYHAIQSRFSQDGYLRQHLDSLTNIVQSQAVTRDTSVVTTEHKKTTTSGQVEEQDDEEEEEKRGFFQRLFGGGDDEEENEEREPEVVEETTVKVDTLSIAKRDSVLANASEIIDKLQREHKSITAATRQSQLELMNTSSLLFTQLLKVLNEVEQEELDRLDAETTLVSDLIDSSADRIYTILIVFALLALLLIILIISDVSKANYYKKQLETERDRANELSEIKERFLANMSHEIRTPLQSILGYSEQLINENPDDKKAGIIHHSSEHLLHIVNEVLDYSRISAGKYELNNVNFNLSDAVGKAVENVRFQAAEKDVRILFEDNADNASVLGDPFRLNQIVYNLLGNAIKFTSDGFVKVSISPFHQDDGRVKLELTIEDSGIGMSEEELKKVFNQFEQANATIASSFGGTGLGLSIVKALVELHNGKIDIESEEGRGTVVHVSMFMQEPTPEADELKVGEAESGRRFHRLLIVDDDNTILDLCELILKKHNVSVKTTPDWEQALEEVTVFKPDAALIDLRMPRISGIDLCEKIKAIDSTVYCIAFTAHVIGNKQTEILEHGFDDLLSKPFTEAMLLEKLNLAESDKEDLRDASEHPFKSAVQQFSMGDVEMEETIGEQFLTDTRKELSLISEKTGEREFDQMLNAVHKLSGKLGMFGAVRLSPKFRRLEERIEQGEHSGKLVEEIHEAVRETEMYCKEVEEILVGMRLE